jgi:two-component system sensor histidine kinase UhpB
MRQWEPTLFWRIFLPNALVLLIAGVVLVLSPASLDATPSTGQLVTLGVGLAFMTGINLMLIRRAVDPLERLSDQVRKVDPLRPGQRVSGGGSAETAQLVDAFNAMLARLETERRESGLRMLAAQEGERTRLARELHDEIGQVVTALILEIDQAARIASPEVREKLAETKEAARALSDELGAIVGRLRPETLDDLGLASAITVLCDNFTDTTGIAISRELPAQLPELSHEAELALYRIAQESLTNVARHAGAAHVSVELTAGPEEVTVAISDDGVGLGDANPGNGVRGMFERALLVGGSLRVEPGSPRGTRVTLSVPVRVAR